MATKLQGTYPLATTLSSLARILVFDGGVTKEILPADLATALGVSGGTGLRHLTMAADTGIITVAGQAVTLTTTSAGTGLTVTFDVAKTDAAITLSAGSLTATCTSGEGGDHVARATHGYNSGKRYFEMNIDVDGLGTAGGSSAVGFATAGGDNFLGGVGSLAYWISSTGSVWNENVKISTGVLATYGVGTRVCVAMDMDAKLIWFRLGAGNWNNSTIANPATGTGGIAYSTGGTLFPAIELSHINDAISGKFSPAQFGQTMPANFQAWNAPAVAPVNTAVPVITGTAQVGQTLNGSNGSWNNSPTSFAYQWIRGITPISGATTNTYSPVAGDVGSPITLTVTATNTGGSVAATSAPTVNVFAAAAPVNTALPVITGTPQIGVQLTCSTGTWNNSPTSYAFQWKVNGINKGSNQNSYIPVSTPTSDQGLTATCTVTATNVTGSTSANAAPTTAIAAGITAAATIDFTAKPSAAALATQGIGFNRTTTGTYIDVNGLVQTAAIDAPRYSYDVNGELGLLIEEPRTNYIWPSIPVTGGSSQWFCNGSITPNAAVAPDGTTTASHVTLNEGITFGAAAGAIAQADPAGGYPPNGVGCVWGWVKGPVGAQVFVFAMHLGNNTTFRRTHTFSGVWERTMPLVTGGPIKYIGYTTTPNQVLNTDQIYGLPAVTFDVWHFQLEDGNFPTSVIPTTTAAKSRGGDRVRVISGTPLSVMQAATGTFYWEGIQLPDGGVRVPLAVEGALISGNTANSWGINTNVAGQPPCKGKLFGGAYVGDGEVGPTRGLPQKIIGRWGSGVYAVCVDSYDIVVDTNSQVPVASSQYGICSRPDVDASYTSALVKVLKFHSVALTNSQMYAETVMPGYTIQSGAPKGAVDLGYTRLVYDFNPTVADIAPGRTGQFRLFDSMFYDGRAPDKSRYQDTADGLLLPYGKGVAGQTRDSTRGILEYLGGIDGFYLEMEWKTNDNHPLNFDAVWAMPKEHNYGYDDSFLYPNDAAGFERWWEFDIHESGFSASTTNSSISWAGNFNAGGYGGSVTNAPHNGFMDQSVPHVSGGSYHPKSNTVRWYLDNHLITQFRGDGSLETDSPNEAPGEHVPQVAKWQQFYMICGAQSHGPYFNASISGTTLTATNMNLSEGPVKVGMTLVDGGNGDQVVPNTLITAIIRDYVPAGPGGVPPEVPGIYTVSISQTKNNVMQAGHGHNLMLKRVRAYSTPTTKNKRIVAYGDSLVFGTGTTNGNLGLAWLPILATELGLISVNKGNGGERSDQIRVRCVDTNVGTQPHDSGVYKYDPRLDVFILEGGFNNFFQTPGTVEADFALMVAALNALFPTNTAKYIIMGVPSGEYGPVTGYPVGYLYDAYNDGTAHAKAAGRVFVDTINANLASTYGTKFLDVNAALIAANPHISGQDATDTLHNIVPASLRAPGDGVHWNDQGQIVVKNAIKAKGTALGYW